MAMFGVGLCLPVLFACIVSTSIVQGRNLRRRHNHHSHPDYYPNFEESMPRDLSSRFGDDLEYPYRRQMERRESFRILHHPAEYEGRISPSPRYKHLFNPRRYIEPLRGKDEEIYEQEDVVEDASTKFRGKRHNKHDVTYQPYSEQERRELREMKKQQRIQRLEQLLHSSTSGLHASFELEVKEAQNSSICNYTVESIPDTRGTRMPKDLEHVKCNHVGSSCRDTGAYCCIQTYRYIQVSYNDSEEMDTMKIYVGCVCALNNRLPLEEYPLGIAVND